MAIVLIEPEAGACIAALEAEESVLISAGTLAEVLIVAARRNIAQELAGLIDGLGFAGSAASLFSGKSDRKYASLPPPVVTNSVRCI